ncbi:open rectifier potassium channel protein 1-like [Prorops nasuta]|uniref:open rectifier potassium channel protein 1-like n=1 Tax=Prorops nasuta TaxID=863751 RepID=UPI0034CDA0B2
MSKKQWMVLLMLFLTYLLLGASIFYQIESPLEIEKVKRAKQERIEINALLHQHYMPINSQSQDDILKKLASYCGKSLNNSTEDDNDLKWDFYNSFYFAYTVVSTIGYGNLAPTNMLSRVLMIFYGLIGIPMNGILLSHLGEFFSLAFVRAHQKYKSYKNSQCDDEKKLVHLETRKAGFAAQICMYLTPGIIMFIFFPAFLFSHYEQWSYEEAVYYAFVTLTTIGFGDYVAGQDNKKGSGVFFILYKTFLILWISFGLGYLVMIMTFIARGMRSKKITRIEHKLAMNLKHTQSKIWNEFNKEVNYLRRVFNELQLSKVKRIYVDEFNYDTPITKHSRSSSFPDLRDLVYGGLEIPQPPHPRRRANSEVVPMDQVTRVVSETDLQRIDKTATFATHAMVQPAELLARLVNILGYIPPLDDNEPDPEVPEQEEPAGVQGFTDKEILGNENTWNENTWRIGNERPFFGKPRPRAASEVRLEFKNEANINQQNGEWTWSGPSASKKLQELIKARRTGLSGIKDAKSKFPSITLPKSVPKTLFPKWMKQFSNKKTEEPSKTASVTDLENGDNYCSQTENDRTEIFNRPYFTHTGANLPSYLEGNNLLEETSLADFLRALTALHTRVGAVPDEFVRKPQRKMGTASLTPPKLPSLLTLFSPPYRSQNSQETVTAAQADRRNSLRNFDNSDNSTNYAKRDNHAVTTRPRRFSLRPVITPSSTPPRYDSPYLSNVRRTTTIGNTSYPTSNAFILDSPKEPLVPMEGAPGVSSPVKIPQNTRRFSLRPAQIGVPPAPATPKAPHIKAIPRWKAGMLQRQIGQMSIQRRVRAFSLSDVEADTREKDRGISPLALDNSKTINSGGRESTKALTSGQKTVTIASPEREILKPADVQSNVNNSVEQNDGWTNIPTNPFSNSFVDSSDKVIPEAAATAIDSSSKETDGRIKNLDDQSGYSDGCVKINISDTKDSTCASQNLDSTGEFKDSLLPLSDKSVERPRQGESEEKQRKVSAVSIGTWADSQRSRKVSTISQQSQNSASSRKSSTAKSPNDKPRVSIDSYKPLIEIKVEKPSVNPFEQYKATMSADKPEDTNLSDIKTDRSLPRRKTPPETKETEQ